MVKYKILLSILFLLGGIAYVSAQTYLYKRVMVVKNGNRINKNDDAHYITFNNKGFYESDKNGYKNANSSFVEFIKDQNDLHCYFGNGYYGENHYYFSRDYSRLNVKIDNRTTYVYQRVTSGSTNANRRKIRESKPSASIPVTTIITSSSKVNSTCTSDNNSHPSSHPIYKTCHVCNGTGKCQSCKGSGVKFVTGGNPNYVPCGGCSNANGNGRCYMCRGTGRI